MARECDRCAWLYEERAVNYAECICPVMADLDPDEYEEQILSDMPCPHFQLCCTIEFEREQHIVFSKIVDLSRFADLHPNFPVDWLARLKDYANYCQCVRDMNAVGKACIPELLKGWGYQRVIQALAAAIVHFGYQYEPRSVILAQQIPMPQRRIELFLAWPHPVIESEFLKLFQSHWNQK